MNLESRLKLFWSSGSNSKTVHISTKDFNLFPQILSNNYNQLMAYMAFILGSLQTWLIYFFLKL